MKLLLSAVEASGDRLGAELIQALRRRDPTIELVGIGGPEMVAAGLRMLPAAVPPVPAMGLVELLHHLGSIRQNRRALEDAIADRPDRFVGIDAPDFHLPLLATARRRGVPAIGYVAPQVWAWRPGRAATVAQQVDRLLCLFPFEPSIFPGLDARWIGHPAVERVAAGDRRPAGGCLAVIPGSRPAEIRRLWPVFREVARNSDATRILLPLAPGRDAAEFGTLPPRTELVDSSVVLAQADYALSKSGTVTLELALASIPTIVAHRVHPLTWLLGRLLVRGVRHLALPNLLLDRQQSQATGPDAPVPEFLQHFTANQLLQALQQRLRPPPAEFLRHLLTVPNDARTVAERAAAAVLAP